MMATLCLVKPGHYSTPALHFANEVSRRRLYLGKPEMMVLSASQAILW